MRAGLADLATDLDFAGPVAIHSGYRGVRRGFGSPEEFVRWVQAARGERWTLFPTFTGSAEDGPDRPPRFDGRSTPCWTGLIPSAAIELLGPQMRSLHPTHSWIGWGLGWSEQASLLLPTETPIGPQSPLGRVIAGEGRVLMIGATLHALTLVHAAEEATNSPYVLQSEPVSCTVLDFLGRETVHPWRLHSWKTPRDYTRLEAPLREAGALEVRPWGLLIHARPAFESLVNLLRHDPAAVLPEPKTADS
ncbi:MAG: AAC(3) family N-acetyltransferase [Fimbriimonadaceae bacterium]|nr:AAC(3) family N-acetyltransferase [Fimbriimonadaceae bacterium]